MYPLGEKVDETLMEEPRKRTRRPMTEKQKAARLANLEAGRKKRMEMVKQKKAGLTMKHKEYDLSSDDDSVEQSSTSSSGDL